MRPKAKDALQPDAAKNVRGAIRKVRTMKGLTNEEIADSLGWEPRKVSNALLESHMLRAATARPILEALYRARPLTDKTQSIIESAAIQLRQTTAVQWLPPRPAALIPAAQVGALATLLADTIAERTGARKTRRDRIHRDLQDALGKKRKELAANFATFWLHQFVASGRKIDLAALLTACGYPDIPANISQTEGPKL